MSYKFAIPSYMRGNKQTTVGTLKRIGYTKEDIILSTQTESDFREYKDKYGEDANVVFAKANNDSQNRNNCLKYFKPGERIILLDDDIRRFCRMRGDGKTATIEEITTRQELDGYFDRMFDFCAKAKSPMWAWYPVANAFFMSETIDIRNIFVGTILGVVVSDKTVFDERYDLKGDYEISLRLMEQGFNAVRFNNFTVVASHNSAGGCDTARKAGRNINACKRILERYPKLIKPGTRPNEIRFTGKTGKVKTVIK